MKTTFEFGLAFLVGMTAAAVSSPLLSGQEQPAPHQQQQQREQPVPYSHKKHLALGLKCNACHKNPEPGEVMGFPSESFCMGCHQAVKTESPHIQKVAAAAKAKQPIEWARVYQVPSFVYFSHRVHLKGGATCESCHGPVAEREVITREVVHTMRSCMACHTAKGARNECSTCHEEK